MNQINQMGQMGNMGNMDQGAVIGAPGQSLGA